MDEKDLFYQSGEASQDAGRPSRPGTASSVSELGDAKTREKDLQLGSGGLADKPEGSVATDDDDDDDRSEYNRRLARVRSQGHGQPDIDHDAGEAVGLGHELDVELAMAPDIEAIQRIETRGSVKSKISRVFTSGSRGSKAKKEGLRAELLPLMDLDRGIVGWDSQDDPAMPLNFPSSQKWLLASLLSAITFITPFASSILSPGISHVNAEFHNTNVPVASLMVSIYLMGYSLGPVLLAPLSEIYGRKIVLTGANVFFCCWQIGCALAPNVPALIVFRLLSGVGGAGCLTLGGGLISDIFRVEDRGVAMGIWALGPLFGPTIGPLVGGFMAETIGWRWDFWVVLIAGACLTILIELLNKETSHRVLIERKVKRLKKELNRDDLVSCYEVGQETQTPGQLLKTGLVRPMKLLFLSPMVFSLSLYLAFVYGVLYLLFTTIPSVFQETYGFNVGITGLVYLALGIGNLCGWLVITLYSDKTVIRLAKANNGVFVPEMRLATTIFFGFFLPITFFWYGWCAHFAVHWAATVLSLIPFGFGIMGLFLPIVTYLVDAYPMYAASAIAANTVLRSMVGAMLPLAGPRMYASLGLGWGNSLLGFLCVGMIPVPMLIYKYGSRMRESQKFKL